MKTQHGLVSIIEEDEIDLIIQVELNDGRIFEIELEKDKEGRFLGLLVTNIEFEKKG